MLSKEQKEELIQCVKYWYHTIDLGDGVFTPGAEGIRIMNQTMIDFLPRSFKGMSILDIGCWDGLFGFEAEKRGASKVLGIDNHSGGDGFSQERLKAIKGGGFKPLMTAKAILGSNVECQVMNVYDISQENIGEFDCTFFFGVLYHLWHPMLALQLIRRVTKKCLFIETHVNETIDQSQPLIRFYPRGEKYEGSTWVGPNLLALYEMLLCVGFKKVMLYRFRDHYERAIGMALIDEKNLHEFKFQHDERFIPFDPGKPAKSYKDRLEQAEAMIETQLGMIREIQSKYAAAERDRVERLEAIQDLALRLDAAESDRAARLEAIQELGFKLDASEANSAARLEVIQVLSEKLQVSEGERATCLAVIEQQKNEIKGQVEELEQVRNNLELMKLSRSWRITAPLRWFHKKLSCYTDKIGG